jgi:hypothetical protein
VVRIYPLLGNGCVFYGSSSTLHKFIKSINDNNTRVETGSNTTTVTLRVVGGDEKRSLISETVKIWSRVVRDSDPKMNALARTNSNCKRQTRPLVREGAPNQQTRNFQTIIKIWS